MYVALDVHVYANMIVKHIDVINNVIQKTKFNKIAIQSKKGSHWLVNSPTLLLLSAE